MERLLVILLFFTQFTPLERYVLQVDQLISQATNANLLSLMYEGWTAWV